MQTLCKPCVFKIVNNNEQSGCKLHLLEKYQRANPNLVIKEDGYFKILERMCIGCRLEEGNWVKKNIGLNLVECVKNEIKFRCDVIVYIDDCHDINDIIATTDSIFNSSHKPEKVIYVYKNSGVSYSKLLKYVTMAYVGKNIKWQLKKIEDENAVFEDVIGEGILDTISEFSTVWIAGTKIPNNFIARIRDELRENMSQFIMILADKETSSGLVIMKKAFIAAGGNKEIELKDDEEVVRVSNFIDKLIVLCRTQGKVNYIWNHNFQSLQ